MKIKILVFLIVCLLSIFSLQSFTAGQIISFVNSQNYQSFSVIVSLPGFSDFSFMSTENGERIIGKNLGYFISQGRPVLPSKKIRVLLPPNSEFRDIKFEGLKSFKLPGKHVVEPAAPFLSLKIETESGFKTIIEKWEKIKKEVYSSDDLYRVNQVIC